MERHKFNIFPEMLPDDYSRLVDDLKNNGYDISQPIYTYDGTILDGWNRMRACKELGITPAFKQFYGDEIAALEFVMRTNKRRNLTSSQWAAIAVDADELIQALKESVERERRKKISERDNKGNQYTQVETVQLIAPSPNEQNKVRTKLANTFNTNRTYITEAARLKTEKPELFEQIKSGEKTITEAKKAERMEKESNRRIVQIADVDIRKGNFVDVLNDVYNIDAIITDPPYPKEFIECFSDLSKYASEHLKDDGFCVVYSGQYNLPEVIRRLSEHLTYVWTFCLYHKGKKQLVNGVNIMCGWKPILIFSNGRKKMRFSAYDVCISDQDEKHSHEWQQSESGVLKLIEIFSEPGDLIVDPFSGSGTFLKVANDLGRNGIGAEINM